jgi:hypothetical protein
MKSKNFNVNYLIKKTSIIGIFVVVVFSCNQPKVSQVVNFDNVETLVGEKIFTIDPYDLTSLEVVDSLLIVINRKGSFIFQFFNISTNKTIIELGKRGKGPGEFIEPTLLISHNNKLQAINKTLQMFDYVSRRKTVIDLSKTLELDSLVFFQERLPYSLGFIDRIWYDSDSLICYRGEDNQINRLTIFNPINSSMKIIPFRAPDCQLKMSNNFERFFYYTQEIDINISRRLIVTAPIFVGQLDFHNFNGDYLYSSKWEHEEVLNKIINEPKKFRPKIHITQIKSDANTIYALNVNGYRLSDKLNQETNSELLLFDWFGNPIKKYILDRRVTNFAIDFKNQYIYGYAPAEHDYTLIKYKL